MATINLGAIRYNWKGAWSNSTAYVINDVVSNGGNSYVAIQAGTNQAVGNATAYWNIMSSAGTNGTNGTDLSTTLTTQGDILYRDGSGLQKLAKGTAGKALLMNSGATAPEWGDVGGGGKLLQVIQKTDITHASFTGSADNSPEAPRVITHLEQAITPSATSSKILITVSLLGSGANNSFPNISHKTSSQVGLGFGTIHSGTALHTNSPSGQSPAMGNDFQNGVSDERIRSANYSFLHSPNTTNAIYYMPTITTWGQTSFYYNRGENDSGAGWYGSGMSSITLMEIGA